MAPGTALLGWGRGVRWTSWWLDSPSRPRGVKLSPSRIRSQKQSEEQTLLKFTRNLSLRHNFQFSLTCGRSTILTLDPALTGQSEGGGRANEVSISYMAVFTSASWASLFSLLIAEFAIVCILFGCFSNIKEGKVIIKSLAFTARSLLQLDAPSPFSSRLSGRVLLLAVALSSVVVAAHYEGMLMSFMTTKPHRPRITSYKDLLNLNYKVIVYKGSKQMTDFVTAPRGSGRQLLYDKMIKVKCTNLTMLNFLQRVFRTILMCTTTLLLLYVMPC